MKYKGGVKLTLPRPPLSSKNPALLGLMIEVDTLQTSYICIRFLVFIFLNIRWNITVSAVKTCSLKTMKVFNSGRFSLLFNYRCLLT